MPDSLALILLVLLIILLIVQLATFFRKKSVDSQSFGPLLESIQASHERTDRSVRQEIAQNREEVMRRRGLPDAIQREFRVVIAGPTTLWAILDSIQMGFRSLAVQKRSSEVRGRGFANRLVY